MRVNNNQEINGIVKNGFDYDLQVWVKGKLIIRLSNGGTIEKEHYGGSDIKKYREKYFKLINLFLYGNNRLIDIY